MIEKKLETLFFFNAENLDFGSIWATLNHLLQQGKFWFCARISHFLHDFTTYSTDKHKLDQVFTPNEDTQKSMPLRLKWSL